jgi:large subunit ribosomal protein L17
MRHNKKFNHLGRKSAHRKAMLSNMATSLIMHKRISTTVPKAKALKVYVEPLLTKSKEDTTNSRRVVFSYLQSKEAVTELFREVSPKIADRPGGYTRILRTGFRLGDNAEMCIIELVDYNENMLKEKAAKKSTRTRRSGVKKAADAVEAPTAKAEAKAVIVEEPAAETPAVEETSPEVQAAEAVAEVPATEETAPEAQAEEVVAEETTTTPEVAEDVKAG